MHAQNDYVDIRDARDMARELRRRNPAVTTSYQETDTGWRLIYGWPDGTRDPREPEPEPEPELTSLETPRDREIKYQGAARAAAYHHAEMRRIDRRLCDRVATAVVDGAPLPDMAGVREEHSFRYHAKQYAIERGEMARCADLARRIER